MPHSEIPFYLKIIGVKYEYQKCCPGLEAKTDQLLDKTAPDDVLICRKK